MYSWWDIQYLSEKVGAFLVGYTVPSALKKCNILDIFPNNHGSDYEEDGIYKVKVLFQITKNVGSY